MAVSSVSRREIDAEQTLHKYFLDVGQVFQGVVLKIWGKGQSSRGVRKERIVIFQACKGGKAA